MNSKADKMTLNRCLSALLLSAALSSPAVAEMKPTLNLGGFAGLMDMPSGEAMPDGHISGTSAHFGPISRTTFSFQFSPRLSGSFRYIAVRNWNFDGFETYYDRAFDLRYNILKEGRYLPSVTVGLQDFIGTGLNSGEYIAATKTFGDRVKVTAGLGWGRLSSFGGVASFGSRPAIDFGRGGTVSLSQWFKGDIAPFAGVEWKVNDRWTFKAEYSSDNYDLEAGTRGTFVRKSPLNFGVEYQRGNMFRYGLYSMYGSEVGLAVHLNINPKRRSVADLISPAPATVNLRTPRSLGWDGNWVADQSVAGVAADVMKTRLAVDGISVEGMALSANRVEIHIRNPQLDSGPQAIGRTARALSHVMPASVEVFDIVPVVNGMALSKVTIRRSDLEQLENAPNAENILLQRVTFADAGRLPKGSVGDQGLYPKFTWRLAPYTQFSYFDPDSPIRGEAGIRLTAKYEVSPGIILSGSVNKRFGGNLDSISRLSNSRLAHVRSDADQYFKNGDPVLERLTAAWYARPGANLYSRISIGYLERMHAGVSGEVLWKPANSRLALGVEVNYTRQRDTNGGLGIGEYNYGVATGHASAYYSFGDGYLAQVDVGRYLAGDIGATFSLDREFVNGWKVGAFATLTDVPFATFGEGSFDKGIRITVPLNALLGKPTRKTFEGTIRPLTRDGGARLDVEGRLYNTVREYHTDRLDTQWGRVLR